MRVFGKKIHIYPSEETSIGGVWDLQEELQLKELLEEGCLLEEVEVSSVYISNRLAQLLIHILRSHPIRKAKFSMCETWPYIWEEVLEACSGSSDDSMSPSAQVEDFTLHRITQLEDSFWETFTRRLTQLKSLKIHHKQNQDSGHLTGLLQRLHRFQHLESLRFDGSQIEDPEYIRALCHSLNKPQSFSRLQKLSFKSCLLSSDNISMIVNSITANVPSLLHLDLSINCCYESGMLALAKLLASPTSQLKCLEVTCQLARSDSPLPVHLLAKALETNTQLESLRLSGNNLRGTDLLGKELAYNRNLLHLDWCGNYLQSDDLLELNRTLNINQSLRTLNIKSNLFSDLSGIDLSQNDTLFRLDHSCRRGTSERVESICRLNRAGRRFLRREPPNNGVWPLVLARSTADPDMLFYVLRNAPSIWTERA